LHPATSQEAFEIFLLEMAQPNRYLLSPADYNSSPPILFLFDNISAISVPSRMKSEGPPHDYIHPHRLWIPFFFTCLLNGTLSHPNAAVVAATSGYPHARTLEIALGLATQESYEQIDRRIPRSVDGATVFLAGDRLTTEEAMGLSSYYKDAGLLKTIDRFDGLSKSVGDEEYYYPESGFWVYNPDNKGTNLAREPFAFKRRGKMNTDIVKKYIARGGIVGKEDPTDLEATVERLTLGGWTARGFWKACTRMSHH
jgi:Mitochondrial ribosomal death-associated protein 3